jgi:selenocysteine lyase/cysteine desulfurase
MIYLDNAATSLPKPETVPAAVLEALHTMASPGRGAHAPALRAAACCYDCREKLARRFRMDDPSHVVFTFNATHGLNIAIRSLVRPGDRVLVSGYEHNAVTRPLAARGAELIVLDTPLFDPDAFLARAAREIDRADVVVCTHVSNVFGYILPVAALAALCRARKKPLILDAAQSAGTLDLDFPALGAEFVAMPGHKGLLGPQGTGVLLCKNDARPLLYGGSGAMSVEQTMPDFLPERLEAGTLNAAGIAGLSAGLDYLDAHGGAAGARAHERALLERLAAGLSGLPSLRVLFSPDAALQCGVLSVLPARMDCETFAAALAEQGVAVRSGLHCAPFAHRTAGTLDTGTVRFSVSPLNTAREIDRAVVICRNILEN